MPETNELALAEMKLEEAKKHLFDAVAAEPLLGGAAEIAHLVGSLNTMIVIIARFRNQVAEARNPEYRPDGC